jgi:hypothetical protein
MDPPRASDGRPGPAGLLDQRQLRAARAPDEAKGKEYFTAEEAQAFFKSRLDRLNAQSRSDIHYDDALWQAENYVKQAHMRTSIIYDPPDGMLPPLTEAAKQREAARLQARKSVGAADNVQVRTLAERCIAWGNVGPPMLPPAYNANFQILQSPEHVVLRHEMMHDVRLIPIDGPAVPSRAVQQLAGIARGHWDGDTLVVTTTNFTSKTNFRGSPQSTRQDIFASETMRVVERFKLTGPDTIDYRFTVDDPSVWTRSWSARRRCGASKGRSTNTAATRATTASPTSSARRGCRRPAARPWTRRYRSTASPRSRPCSRGSCSRPPPSCLPPSASRSRSRRIASPRWWTSR